MSEEEDLAQALKSNFVVQRQKDQLVTEILPHLISLTDIDENETSRLLEEKFRGDAQINEQLDRLCERLLLTRSRLREPKKDGLHCSPLDVCLFRHIANELEELAASTGCPLAWGAGSAEADEAAAAILASRQMNASEHLERFSVLSGRSLARFLERLPSAHHAACPIRSAVHSEKRTVAPTLVQRSLSAEQRKSLYFDPSTFKDKDAAERALSQQTQCVRESTLGFVSEAPDDEATIESVMRSSRRDLVSIGTVFDEAVTSALVPVANSDQFFIFASRVESVARAVVAIGARSLNPPEVINDSEGTGMIGLAVEVDDIDSTHSPRLLLPLEGDAAPVGVDGHKLLLSQSCGIIGTLAFLTSNEVELFQAAAAIFNNDDEVHSPPSNPAQRLIPILSLTTEVEVAAKLTLGQLIHHFVKLLFTKASETQPSLFFETSGKPTRVFWRKALPFALECFLKAFTNVLVVADVIQVWDWMILSSSSSKTPAAAVLCAALLCLDGGDIVMTHGEDPTSRIPMLRKGRWRSLVEDFSA